MKRRPFIKLTAAGVVGLGLTSKQLLAQKPQQIPIKVSSGTALSLSVLFPLAMQAVQKDLKEHGRFFRSNVLERARRSGAVNVVTLGEIVECVYDNYTSSRHEIKRLTLPCAWTTDTEKKNPSEKQRIDLSARMALNSTASIDDMLEELLSYGNRLVVSKQYRYYCGPVYTVKGYHKARYCLCYTAYAEIPAKGEKLLKTRPVLDWEVPRFPGGV